MDEAGLLRNVVLMVRHAAGGHPRGPTAGQAVAALRAVVPVLERHVCPTPARRDELDAVLARIVALPSDALFLGEAHAAAMRLRDHLRGEEKDGLPSVPRTVLA